MKATGAAHAMWLNVRLGMAGTAYHMPLPVVLTGRLDRDRLARACLDVVARHIILGCAFREIDGDLHVVRAAHQPHVSFEPDDVDRPFDLENGPLIRFSITPCGPDRHGLLVVAHHLVFDGMSKDILLRDLAAAYNGTAARVGKLRRGAAPAGHMLSEQGNTGVALATPVLPSKNTYPLGEAGDVMLPGLGPVARKAIPGECLDFEIGDVSSSGLTRFELLLTTLFGLLVRYGNVEPVVALDLGTRTPQEADQVGYFVNELPLRVEVHSGHTSAELASAVQTSLRELYTRRRTPAQASPRLALAPVSISYRKRGPAPTFDGLQADVEWMAYHGSARNALHVQMVDDGSTVRVRFQYGPSQLSRRDAERIATHYQHLLRGFLDLPGTPIKDLPMLVPGELTSLSGPVRAIDDGRVENLITGGGIAVVGAGRELTYDELDRAAEAVAVKLRDCGVRPGDRVAVRMRRSPELIAALLGVWKAGAAYVPLDPGYPAARQSLLLSDARPKALLAGDQAVALTGGARSPRELAYVIYTSGSTGRPKGVEVEHRSVINLLRALPDALQIKGRPVWLAVASYAFDMSIPELWLPLTMGGTVVMATEEETRDAERLLKLIRDMGVTHVHVTPSTWQRLLDVGFDEPGMVAISGAEALPEPLARQIKQRSARLWNLYGPTETTVWSTYAEVGDGPVSIGRPLANTGVHVMDEHMRPVPQGVPGELCIGGAGVARGYLGQPELTAERFVGGLYRTGDRVRLRHDGALEWIGRKDNQIKLRGYRVELGEIEARLLEHPRVRAAAAAVHDGPTLVAYVVGDAPDLREHMAEALPAHLVPGKFVYLDNLPLNANGKLDRSRLPAPAPKSTLDVHEGLAAQIYAIWCEVLGRTDIGLDDDLFDLGGHSLTVTKISARMRRNLGIDLPLHVFFDTPTIRGLVGAAKKPTATS